MNREAKKIAINRGFLIRALFDGTKTQHRVPVERPIPLGAQLERSLDGFSFDVVTRRGYGKPARGHGFMRCPYGRPGDLLWVGESFLEAGGSVGYRADFVDDPDCSVRWQSARRMPRRASRLTLHIDAVRAQRVRQVGEAEAEAEGMRYQPGFDVVDWYDPVATFCRYWQGIYGASSWNRDGFVFVLHVRAVRAHVDDVLQAPAHYGLGEPPEPDWSRLVAV